jgi:hypothetical protein
MAIVFFCQSCGARFEVSPQMAGKQGRCKKCGQHMSIPRAEQVASMAAIPALVGAGASAAAAPAGVGNWLGTAKSSVGLAPLTIDRMPIGRKPSPAAPKYDDDLGDSKPYVLATPVRESRGRAVGQVNMLAVAWRRQLGGIQRLFRWLNETAYLVSVPFIMALLVGIAVRNRPLALFGATLVVLINIGRFAAGIANIVVIPFRDGLQWKKLKRPARRIAEPALTIGLVVLAFTFIPWLSRGEPKKGESIGERLRESAGQLKREIRGEVEKAGEIDTRAIGSEVSGQLNDLKSKAKGTAKSRRKPPQ